MFYLKFTKMAMSSSAVLCSVVHRYWYTEASLVVGYEVGPGLEHIWCTSRGWKNCLWSALERENEGTSFCGLHLLNERV